MYAELHALSNFSFLRSASHPEELVIEAAKQGYKAIALTDECSFAGVVKAHVAAKKIGIPLIIGSEFHSEEGCHLIALACNRRAYSEISALITLARRRAEKGEYQLRLKDIQYNLNDSLVIWKPHYQDDNNSAFGQQLKSWLDNRLWLGVSQLYRNQDHLLFHEVAQLSDTFCIPLVACGDVHMHSRKRKPLHDTLTAIRLNTPLQKLGQQLQSNSERHIRPIKALQNCYPPELLSESLAIAQRCTFSLDEIRYNYPKEVVPPGQKPSDYLKHLVSQGSRERWPEGTPDHVAEQIDTELQLIAELKYEYYFLTVYDIVQFARSRDILCQGRGSAANSAVCYCLMITEVPPDKMNLLFERFISKERDEPPDIDVDFEHERREEVIQYIYKKYSRERAALAATLITYRPRSAIRDVGRALGLDAIFITQLSKSLAWWDRKKDLEQRFQDQGLSTKSKLAKQFFFLLQEIQGFPRHLSQHVGGFIITQDAISQLVPVENASMPERTVIQWDKESIEALGLLKVDVLALGMLTAIRKALKLIEQHHNQPLRIQDIPADDSKTYAALQAADTVGVFQVESRAQMSMLPRLKPRCFYDLVVQVAIVRPGPIQGDMVHPYLRRRNGEAQVHYENAEIKAVLERTLGVPIFQEQVIKLAMVAAGFTGGEADELRRAMASWGKNGNLMQFQTKLKNGMLARGHSSDFVERLFNQMKGFGAYGFPESHAASFALLVYISAWLKTHYPAAFYCALLNSLPMGFYSPSQIVQDAKRHAITILPIDINHSDYDHRLENEGDSQSESGNKKAQHIALRLGMRLCKGVRKSSAESISKQRIHQGCYQAYTSIEDLKQRSNADQASLQALAAANAFDSLKHNRYQANWQVLSLTQGSPLPLIPSNDYQVSSDKNLPAPSEVQSLKADYNQTGLSLGRHPLAILKEQHPDFARCTPHKQLSSLSNKRFVRIVGLVTGRQRPGTANGTVFLTLEDETGNANVIVWRDVQERCREALLKGKLLRIEGVAESNENVVHVIAGRLTDFSQRLNGMESKSRDFH